MVYRTLRLYTSIVPAMKCLNQQAYFNFAGQHEATDPRLEVCKFATSAFKDHERARGIGL